jgi:hypothetical protein
MSVQVLVDRCLLHRVLIVLLVALVLSQGLLLWGTEREVQLLPRLARTGVLPAQGQIQDLELPELLDGLSRLGGAPELMLDQTQAMRLVPVVPLFRQALTWGVETRGEPAPDRFGPMLRDYLVRTLRVEQLAHLAFLAQKGELASKPDVALEKLALLDKTMRRRAGAALDRSPSVQSPVRKSLDQMRIRDLLLGMLLIEQEPEFRLTAEQTSMLLPMLSLFRDIFDLKAGVIGQNLLPVVDAQVRSILTESQQQRLLQMVQANRLNKIEVDEDEVIRQFSTLLSARQAGEVHAFHLHSLTAPLEEVREGPTVIPGGGELELLLAIRGIVIHLESRQDLRLDEDQVAKLALLAPGIQEVMNNLFKGIKDDRQPEIQIRVARILRVDQIEHILKHKAVPYRALDYTPGEDPVVVEFARFIQARTSGKPFTSRFEPVQGAISDASSAMHPSKTGLLLPNYIPLEAVIRAILFQLEKEPRLRLQPTQVEALRERLPRLEKALNAIEKGQRSEEAQKLAQELAALLSDSQKHFLKTILKTNEQASLLPLQPSWGESPLSRELRRFVAARSANQPYTPLLNQELTP